MKRCFLLLVLSAILVRAEEVKLPKNVIMHVEKSLISVKAGTVVQVIKRDAKAITVKVDNKTGTIPLDSFVAPPPEKAAAMVTATPMPAIKTDGAAVAKPTTPAATTPAPSGAVTNYGKMVEKARGAADQHDKAAVPDDGLLDTRK